MFSVFGGPKKPDKDSIKPTVLESDESTTNSSNYSSNGITGFDPRG